MRARLDRLFTTFWDFAGSFSVRTKIFGIVLGSTLMLSLAFTTQVRLAMLNLLEEQAREQGTSIARDVAARATDLILINDMFSLYQLLIETQANYHDVRYVFIVDPEGEVLAHSFSGGFPIALIDANQVQPGTFQNTVVLETNEGTVWDVAVPIFDGKSGTARVGISKTSVFRTLKTLTSNLLITILAVLGVSLLAATFLTWVLTRPILSLAQATQRIAQGDFSPRVKRWADDEIGDLADAFNQMAIELGRTEEIRSEREQLRRQLLEGIIAAQEEERRRIARELHDSTSQSLTSLKVGLRNLEDLCDLPELRSHIEDLRHIVSITLDDIHILSVQLRPSVLDDLGLAAAIHRLVEEWYTRYQIPIDSVVHLGDRRLPAPIEIALYRIIQEALTNIARHSQATSASLLAERHKDDVVAVIEDNGIGFVSKNTPNGLHLGLLGIQERTELLGGKLTIETTPSKGTSLFIRIPLDPHWEKEGLNAPSDSHSTGRRSRGVESRPAPAVEPTT